MNNVGSVKSFLVLTKLEYPNRAHKISLVIFLFIVEVNMLWVNKQECS